MAEEPELESPRPENAKPAAQTWRILFLDASDNIELLKAACKDAGYVVIGATTLEEAWAFLHGKNHVDVIVCAAHLEEESMFEFLQGVRASDLHRASEFLILSLEPNEAANRLERSTRSTGLALGASSYVVMPQFDAPALIGHIRKLQPAVPVLQQTPPAEEP